MVKVIVIIIIIIIIINFIIVINIFRLGQHHGPSKNTCDKKSTHQHDCVPTPTPSVPAPAVPTHCCCPWTCRNHRAWRRECRPPWSRLWHVCFPFHSPQRRWRRRFPAQSSWTRPLCRHSNDLHSPLLCRRQLVCGTLSFLCLCQWHKTLPSWPPFLKQTQR